MGVPPWVFQQKGGVVTETTRTCFIQARLGQAAVSRPEERVRTVDVLSGEAAQLPGEIVKNPTVSPRPEANQQSEKWVN